MNRNIIIVLAGGLLIAILVAMMVQATLSGSKKPAEELKKVQILVAAKNLDVGKEIKSGDLKWQDWPEETTFVGAIIRDGQQQPTEAIKGKLLRSLVLGQPVHMTIVSEEDQGNFLSANVQKGMRAVGVSLRSSVLADRLIRPGDFVDVMVTYRVRINSRANPEAQSLVNRYATETVMENVRILAIDKNDTKAVDEEEAGKKKKVKKSSKKATVTLEVHPENAEKLVLADKMGDIGIALRSIGDNSVAQNDKTTTDVGMSRVMTNLTSLRGSSSAVRIYNGAQMQEAQARSTQTPGRVDFNVEAPQKFDEEAEGTTATVTFSPGALQQIIEETAEE